MDKKTKDFQEKLLATFKIEAGEHVQAMASGLIELERKANPEKRARVIEGVFREAHSLKGAARAVGATEIETICQALESLFSDLKCKADELSPGLFDVLHDAVDALGKILFSLSAEAPGKEKLAISDLLRRLDGVLKGAKPAPRADSLPAIQDKDGDRLEGNAGPAAQAYPPPNLEGERDFKASAKTEPVPDAGMDSRPSSEPRRSPVEEKTVLADTVRIATTKLDALLFQAEGLLSAKLTASHRAAEIREVMTLFVSLKKGASQDRSQHEGHPACLEW